MKKQILILVSLLLCNLGFSQNVVENYSLDILEENYVGQINANVTDKKALVYSPKKNVPPPKPKGEKINRLGFQVGGAFIFSRHNLDEVNTILHQYNQNHAHDLEKEMDDLSNLWLGGFEGSGYYNQLFFGLDVYWRQNETYARGLHSSGEMRDTYFRLEHRTFGVNLGYMMHHKNWMKIVLGATYQFGQYKFLSSSLGINANRKEFQLDPLFEPHLKPNHAGGFLKIIIGKFDSAKGSFRLFVEGDYLTGVNKSNLLKVNEALNPSTFMNDDNENLNLNNSYFAGKVGILMGIGK